MEEIHHKFQLNLVKILPPGELRWIASEFDSLSPQATVIAGNTIRDISTATTFKCFKIGNINPANAFVAYDQHKIFYVFVDVNYRNYKYPIVKLLGTVPSGYHIDHILARNLAKHFGYKYVALCMVPEKVNLRHGWIEKIKVSLVNESPIPSICFADERVFQKILSRNPEARMKKEDLILGFSPIKSPTYGLTLKQKGLWNTAFGFDKAEKEKLDGILKLIEPTNNDHIRN